MTIYLIVTGVLGLAVFVITGVMAVLYFLDYGADDDDFRGMTLVAVAGLLGPLTLPLALLGGVIFILYWAGKTVAEMFKEYKEGQDEH